MRFVMRAMLMFARDLRDRAPAKTRQVARADSSDKRRIIVKLAPRLLGTVLLTLFSIAPAVAADSFSVVLDGLQSPRGLTFAPGGRLYVAQAGNGRE